MKYEEWIQYENLRQGHPALTTWVTLPGESTDTGKKPLSKAEKPPVWTMVIQIFNSRRI